MHVLNKEDAYYPKLLLNIHDPPKTLYVKGQLLESDEKSIAIVGTRRPTYYGLNTARKFARELAGLGITIVSGLAFGIDAAAHEGALEAGGRTIAVLGSGINNICPRENIPLSEKIINSGAILSELKPDEPPAKWTFPRRNRIISGLSLGTIVVEGGYKSGAMITGKLAIDQGREVFAVPGQIGSELSQGPHWLIKQGAKLVENIDDILDELTHVLNIQKPVKKDIQQSFDFSILNDEETLIIKQLSYVPTSLDSIIKNTGVNTTKALISLSQLELKGFVKQLPGKMFVVATS